MLDSIQPYLDEGEIIYAGRMNYIIASTGKNRARLLGLWVYGVNQNRCAISWTNPISLTKETREFPIDPAKHQSKIPLDTLLRVDSALSASLLDTLLAHGYVFELDSLEEGQHDFSLVLFDPQGNASIPIVSSVYVYGQAYEKSLINRNIKSISTVKINGSDAVHIRWVNSRAVALTGCILQYQKSDGAIETLSVAVSDTATDLTSYLPGGKWGYTTTYLPNGSMDAFYASVEEYTLPAGSGF
jgi:hypothetical protein